MNPYLSIILYLFYGLVAVYGLVAILLSIGFIASAVWLIIVRIKEKKK